MKSEDTPASGGGREEDNSGSSCGEQASKSKHHAEIALWNNLVTIGGIYIALMALILLITFGLFSIVSPASNPYVDIIGYLVIPIIMAIGVAMMPLGILFKSWKLHRKDPTFRMTLQFPRINLNDPKQRSVAKVVLAGVFLLLPILGVSSYHGYHFTDSVEFCAEACHDVMEPQAVAFQSSAHARVACAECHIGSGAGWFVKSKLSGTRQVIAVFADSYSRPIPPAIKHLRPARDTCEQCHWPKMFFGSQLREIPHYRSDEQNTRRQLRMLVKTGGADESTGRAEGIHAHMLMSGLIEYVAVDDKLQEIPWVRWVNPIGQELIYRSDGLSAADPPPDGRRRQIDCMDCHNRPGHRFLSPDRAVNAFLDAGRIDATLPYIKREAVAALSDEHSDLEAARLKIANRILDFYHTNYPQRFERDGDAVKRAADATADIYRQNIFPFMNVDWRTYPDNIGHLESPGCYRCHDGKHFNQYGQAISNDCNACHTFLEAVSSDGPMKLLSEGAFVHPYELEGVHAELRCDQCHSGGPALPPDCAGCHTKQQALYAGEVADLSRYELEPNAMFGSVECADCHDLDEPLSLDSVNTLCVDCHDDDYENMLDDWQTSLDKSRGEAHDAVRNVHEHLSASELSETRARSWVIEARANLAAIEAAHAQHNPAGVLAVYKAIAQEGQETLASLSGDAGTGSVGEEAADSSAVDGSD